MAPSGANSAPQRSGERQPITRITNGCEFCRRRHLRCSGMPAPCVECGKRAQDCVFGGPGRRRGPPRGTPKPPKRNSGSVKSNTDSEDGEGSVVVSAEDFAAPAGSPDHRLETAASFELVPIPMQPTISFHPSQLALPPTDIAAALLQRALTAEPYAMVPLLHRPTFIPRGPDRPPWLLWSMMAAAARFDRNLDEAPGAPPGGWSLRLFNLASTSLSSVLGSLPSLPTIQALIYLAFVAVIETDLAAYIKPIMTKALAMSREMGLDRSSERWTMHSPLMPWKEREERRRTFWLLYGLDRLISAATAKEPLIGDADLTPAEPFVVSEIWEGTDEHSLSVVSRLSPTSVGIFASAGLFSSSAAAPSLPTVPKRQLELDNLLQKASYISMQLGGLPGSPQFGPGSETAATARSFLSTALDAWALSEEACSQFEALQQSVAANGSTTSNGINAASTTAYESESTRWFFYHLARVYLNSPRPAVTSVFKPSTRNNHDPRAALPAIGQWLADPASAVCAEHIKAIAGWLADLVRFDGRAVDRNLSILGQVAIPVAYCAMAWVLLGGKANSDRIGNYQNIQVIGTGTKLTRSGGPRVADQDVFAAIISGLKAMGRVWKVSAQYAQALEQVSNLL